MASTKAEKDYVVPRSSCSQNESVEPRFRCKTYACAIQECLAKYDYQQSMCAKEVETLVRCCQTLEFPAGSLHCQGFLHLINKDKAGASSGAAVAPKGGSTPAASMPPLPP